jgi:hypothetical protein
MKKVVRLTESDLTRLVKRIINEMDDDEFFYKEMPGKEYYYDKYDRVGPTDDEFGDFDTDEFGDDEFDTFISKYPFGDKQNTFPDDEHGRRWFKGYAQSHGGRFPVFKRKRKK